MNPIPEFDADQAATVYADLLGVDPALRRDRERSRLAFFLGLFKTLLGMKK